jgi:photosystem I subunit 3
VREAVGKLGATLALAAVATFGVADLAEAKTVKPYAGLVPCSTSAAFAKREKNEVKGLTKRLAKARARARPRLLRLKPSQITTRALRAPPAPAARARAAAQAERRHAAGGRAPALLGGLAAPAQRAPFTRSRRLALPCAPRLCSPAWPAPPPAPFTRRCALTLPACAPQYEAGSAPALALNATIEKTHTRFKNYGEQGLLCGADGLPHLIVDGNLEHLGEFTIPGLGFLYTAGWIGYAGRSYVMKNKLKDKPLDGEIIIDVPGALNIMFASAGWPLLAVRELQKGTLLEDDANITGALRRRGCALALR